MDASDWVDRFVGMIDGHVASERDLLDTYARARDRVEDPTIGYLLAAIVEDEERHHELLGGLRDRVTEVVAGAAPHRDHAADRDVVAPLTRRLLELERGDLEEIRHLRDGLERVRRTGPWGRLRDVLRTTRTDGLGEADREALDEVRTDLEVVDDTILWSLVLRILELDTHKHIEILEAIDEVVAARGVTGADGPIDL